MDLKRLIVKLMFLGLLSSIAGLAADEHKASSVDFANPLKLSELWQTQAGELKRPESAYVFEKFVYVSNLGEVGLDKKDGDGFIQKYDLNGKLIKAKWISGLNDPKGMRAYGQTLWTSDVTELVAIHLGVGTVRNRYKIKDAVFLNDVAVDQQGGVYVSDTLGSAIYLLKDGKIQTFVKGPEWESPNGLLLVGDQLIVAAWGFVKSFSEKASGHLYSINLNTKERKNLSNSTLEISMAWSK